MLFTVLYVAYCLSLGPLEVSSLKGKIWGFFFPDVSQVPRAVPSA